MKIYCCACEKETDAQMITGATAYPHRPDLSDLPLWQCPVCNNFVGCHHKRKNNPFVPLGVIATPQIKKARMALHAIIDPLWRNGIISRKKLYKAISNFLGYEYHTAETRSIKDIERVKEFVIKTYKINNQKD